MHRACLLAAFCGSLLLSARADGQTFFPRAYGPTRGRYIGEQYAIPAPTIAPSVSATQKHALGSSTIDAI